QARLQGRPEKISNRHTWNFAGILKGEEKTASRAFIGFKLQKILAVHQYLAGGDVIIRMTGQNLGQRAFSRAIWAHERVHFTPRHTQSQSTNDLLIAHSYV